MFSSILLLLKFFTFQRFYSLLNTIGLSTGAVFPTDPILSYKETLKQATVSIQTMLRMSKGAPSPRYIDRSVTGTVDTDIPDSKGHSLPLDTGLDVFQANFQYCFQYLLTHRTVISYKSLNGNQGVIYQGSIPSGVEKFSLAIAQISCLVLHTSKNTRVVLQKKPLTGYDRNSKLT